MKHSEKKLNVDKIISDVASFGFDINVDIASQLLKYIDMLLMWNSSMNLIGANDYDTVFHKLILDSFYIAQILEIDEVCSSLNPISWDLGAGAGLPGIPLRILWQRGEYTLIESRQKRSLFMRTFLARNPLPSTFVKCCRAEDFMPNNPPADIILSKAFMPWEKLVDFAMPYLSKNGRLILLLNTEIPNSTEHAKFSIVNQVVYQVGTSKRFLTVIGKSENIFLHIS